MTSIKARRSSQGAQITSVLGWTLPLAALLLAGCSSADDTAPARPPLTTDPTNPVGTGPAGPGGNPTVGPLPSTDPTFVPDPVEGEVCGDGKLGGEETCDDGNQKAGDGCAPDCFTEANWFCPPEGGLCELTDLCGDGRQSSPETCDDGNTNPGDGCSSSCGLESGWSCPTPGMPCTYTVVCGDGIPNGTEQCDDLNTRPGDGCAEDCSLEPGWSCPDPGGACIEVCGDGAIVGNESCDDGNAMAGDGCSATCVREAGFACDAEGCHETVCGDGIAEGDEACDDGADINTGDGCSPGCRLEPNCDSEDGTCRSQCGDGMLLPGDDEQCDDGNDEDGDGCSSTCMLEQGFSCTNVNDADADVLRLPIVYRDFKGMGSNETLLIDDGHPDFENPDYSADGGEQKLETDTQLPGIVASVLGSDGKPVFAQQAPYFQTNGQEYFDQWFHDASGVNVPVVSELVLNDDGNGAFEYDNPYFFPIDGLGWTDAANADPEPLRETQWFNRGCWSTTLNTDIADQDEDGEPDMHNFSFTSELRYWFEFKGGENLSFRGDDDVWVFIKRRLVVDLGGVHTPMGGNICGRYWGEQDTEPACAGLTPATTDVDGEPLDLVPGQVYEAVLFQAERHTCQSNFRLTLAGFSRTRTQCESVCGDGMVAGDERCDDAAMNGTGYGYCNADCTPGPRCGDGVLNGPEQCDNGLNLDGYFADDTSCAPGCVAPPFCGDGIVNAEFGEECDLGAEQNTGAYDGCTSVCELGPRCGDGEQDPEEACDDGNLSNNDGCSLRCTKEFVDTAH